MSTGMSMELSNYLVSWVVTYLGDLQPSYIGGYNLFTKFHGHPSRVFVFLLESDEAKTPLEPEAAAAATTPPAQVVDGWDFGGSPQKGSVLEGKWDPLFQGNLG